MERAKILVVDDERSICRNVKKILSKSNYEVSEALSAEEAMGKMAKETFALLISDIVMPGTNGLELLRLVKKQWPLAAVIMMTAYSSTDTAVRAIRLGALGYLPKPFTPKELRSMVKDALSGDLVEAKATKKEREAIDVIDIDIPFDRDEVAKVTGDAYADMIGPSDMPVIEITSPESLPYYCAVGEKVCDIYKKLGNTCKGGLKTNECPQKKAKKKEGPEKKEAAFDANRLIGIDQPFSYQEVISVTGPEYLQHLEREGVTFVPYEALKEKIAERLKEAPTRLPVRPEFVDKPSRETILVIDDEAAVNNNIRRILSKKGYRVEQAMTKSEALEKISEKEYRLVLLDLKIPGVKDLELLETIRKERPNTMVIIITGYASIETAVETARLGAVDYLPKPFTPDEIRQVTGRALGLAA
ncbi:MAG: response regulator [Desulfatiglandales bacterium]